MRLTTTFPIYCLLVLLSGCRQKEIQPITLLFSTEIKGQIEPCGCTSNPMGDLSRIAQIVSDRRQQGPVLFIDGGSLLFNSTTPSSSQQSQDSIKATLIADIMTNQIAATAIGLGPYDLSYGKERLLLPRHAVNIVNNQDIPIAPPQIISKGAINIGIFGVTDPKTIQPIQTTDPITAAIKAVQHLAPKTDVIIAIAHMNSKEAIALAEAVSHIDFLLVGQQAPDPDNLPIEPERIGNTWLIYAANRGQTLREVKFVYKNNSVFLDAIGKDTATHLIQKLDKYIQQSKTQLEGWKKDSTADPSFLARQTHEINTLQKERHALEKNPLRIPDKNNWFVMRNIFITKNLHCNKTVVESKTNYYKKIGQLNRTNAASEKKQTQTYVGINECTYCHQKATSFWEKTRHAMAWNTLTTRHREFDLECIGCHVTGFDKQGGATLGNNTLLRNVQCEVCHGAGANHVENDGHETPSSMILTPPESTCITCHNEEHSDTFDYTAYLRDITGKGHGELFRKKLGQGNTGKELRTRALLKAGKTMGKHCPK